MGRVCALAIAAGFGAAVALSAPAVADAAPAETSGSSANAGPRTAAPRKRSADSPVSWTVLAAARREIGQDSARNLSAAAVLNRPPVISAVSDIVPNSATGIVTGTVKATDPNGDRLTYKATTSTNAKVTVTAAGVFTYTPTASARHAAARAGAATSVTTDTVTFTVTDAKGASVTKAVTLAISPQNAAPVKSAVSMGSPNGVTGTVTGTVSATDADRDTLTYSVPAFTAKGSVSINANTGAFNYTPTAKARDTAAASGAKATDRTDGFTVTVTDGYGGKTAVAVTVPVSPDALIGLGRGETSPESHLFFDGIPAGTRIVEVQTHVIVDQVPLVGLNFFALQVDFPNQTWAHGGPQFNDGLNKLANWGGLVDHGGGAADYEQINWATDLSLIDSGEDKPNTVAWQWDSGREYILSISRGDRIVLPAGINTAHDNVMLPERTMWVWNFTITPADGKGEAFTSRLFDSADYISWFCEWNESGYGSLSEQQHARWSIPVYRVEGSTDYRRPPTWYRG